MLASPHGADQRCGDRISGGDAGMDSVTGGGDSIVEGERIGGGPEDTPAPSRGEPRRRLETLCASLPGVTTS